MNQLLEQYVEAGIKAINKGFDIDVKPRNVIVLDVGKDWSIKVKCNNSQDDKFCVISHYDLVYHLEQSFNDIKLLYIALSTDKIDINLFATVIKDCHRYAAFQSYIEQNLSTQELELVNDLAIKLLPETPNYFPDFWYEIDNICRDAFVFCVTGAIIAYQEHYGTIKKFVKNYVQLITQHAQTSIKDKPEQSTVKTKLNNETYYVFDEKDKFNFYHPKPDWKNILIHHSSEMRWDAHNIAVGTL